MHEAFPTLEAEAKRHLNERSRNLYVPLEHLESDCASDEVLHSLLEDVKAVCLRYAETVCRFQELAITLGPNFTGEQRNEIEALRKQTHDAVITNVDILARNMRRGGKNVEWSGKLINRAEYMRFALIIGFEIVGRGAHLEVSHG